MPALFMLDVITDADGRSAQLRLSDDADVHLAAHDVKLASGSAAQWEGLFDTRTHVRRMEAVRPAELTLAELGSFLASVVLGPDIMRHLAAGEHRRTLLIRLPDTATDRLAAAFARVPWEIARAEGDARTLLQRNVVVRAMMTGTQPGGVVPVQPAAGEPIRVLLVFAEAPGSRPLAMRLERERLRELFFGDILPKRDVELDVLCHGVTRTSVREQVRARGGYHAVHWSGHGHHDLLEIGLDEGEQEPPWISGADLVNLFTGAGGFIPSLVFLSACLSGSLVSARDWTELRRMLRDPEGIGTLRDAPALERLLADERGYTGTALALLRAGVRQVVAMRYAVGDNYARRLARRFYRGLLAESAGHAVDGALAIARRELIDDLEHASEHHAVDHATPIVLGAESIRFTSRARRSAQMDRREPKPQPLLPSGSKDLDPPRGFVGRSGILTQLARSWLRPEGVPIAMLQGLAGLGKTALAAEAIHLWHDRFDHVLAFQARGGALPIEELYRQIDARLTVASPAYRERCAQNDLAKIYVPPGLLSGAQREETQRSNLINALRSERVLLVLDNFESNLRTVAGPDGYASSDPAWDRLLEVLADRLRESGSRVLVTTRHRLTSLADPKRALWFPLGPLPRLEALLFFQGYPALRKLWFSDEADDRRLAERILTVSGGHPLILQRLASLAQSRFDVTRGLTLGGWLELDAALDRIQGDGFRTLPDLFADAKTEAEKEQQRKYLEDAAVGSVDLLLEQLGADARQLLWIITRAAEPVPEALIEVVWSEAAPVGPLLDGLRYAGLVSEDDASREYGFHELVAERAAAWMDLHPGERAGRTEEDVWEVFGNWYGAAFRAVRDSGKPGAAEAATEVGRRGIRYLILARSFDALRTFASAVVTGTRNRALLGQVIADLQAAAELAPAGKVRWRVRTYLADALKGAGRSEQALQLFELAAEEAKAAGHWANVGWILNNWAVALQDVGKLDQARETFRQSAEIERRAGRPPLYAVGSELEMLRIDVQQGDAEDALPKIEARLGDLRVWWTRQQRGDVVSEAPGDEMLFRALLSGLNVACSANIRLKRWQPCLDLLDELESLERAAGAGEHTLASTRFNRYAPLLKLGKLAEAKEVLEGSLDVFRQEEDVEREAKALGALADVWNKLGDVGQAIGLGRVALAANERLPDPESRAISHGNLSIYLHKAGQHDEANDHWLADLVYRAETPLNLQHLLHNLVVDARIVAARGERFELPRLVDLLARPQFAVLRAFLNARSLSPEAIQPKLDELIEQARAGAIATPSPSDPDLPAPEVVHATALTGPPGGDDDDPST